MLLELLEKIDKREYLTEEEHKLYLKELEFMAKLFDDLTTGNMVSYHGKFIAMNKKKYYEYRDKQLVSAEAVAFTQQRNEEIEKVLKIVLEKEVNMQVFNQCEDVETYNKVYIKQKDRQLAQEEFDTIKEGFEYVHKN